MLTPARVAIAFVLLLPFAAPARQEPPGSHSGPSDGLFFSGTSASGNLQEALDAAVEAARAEFGKYESKPDFRWELEVASGRRSANPDARSLSATIRITRGVPAALVKPSGPRER